MEPNQDEPQSLLDTLRSHHVVHVHNPLSDAFTWGIARPVSQFDQRYKDPFTDKLGLQSQKPVQGSHVQQKITIPAGGSLKMPGDVAQVYVKHLVDEMIARTEKKTMITNPVLRREKEEQVILNTADLRQTIGGMDIQAQLDAQLAELNKTDVMTEGATNATEQAFPGLQLDGIPAPAGNTQSGSVQPAGKKAAAGK